ncbi:lactate dehydrogenase [Salmonella enterica]|nr:lactate dehydrogenase [Salmonella enterica]
MNAVEIEQAITDLAEQPFDPIEFPYAFLEAFGNKETTIKRLRAGASNKSDLGGVLQTNNIHILASEEGQVTQMLASLKASPATGKAKAKFILATDGKDFEAEDLISGQTVACAFKDFPDHFGFFLPLAGISTVRQISEDAFDIRATSRLNRLYVELLKDNPEWGTAERRHDMNKFMARLIFCFFAEDTDIFIGKGRFTDTIAQMSERDASNMHEVIGTLFRAMNTPDYERAAVGIPRWAAEFPYVNGALFSGTEEVPRFSRIARSYLLHVGNLDWTRINPDIFGSMIQAIAEDEERGELGMHYTSVPNILKVLNPLFLDELRSKLEDAGENPRALLNLRKLLPLRSENWITCGNALRIDWYSLMDVSGSGVKVVSDDILQTPLDQAEIEFEHEGSETYICGNPPYKGTKNQSAEQKADLLFVFSKYPGTFKVLDYVSAWFVKTAEYLSHVNGAAAFVSTNSICQGNQVPVLWPLIMGLGVRISFAYTSFKWSNLATHNAGVTVVVIGLTRSFGTKCRLFEHQGEGIVEREVDNINAYLVPNADIFINKKSDPPPGCAPMVLGNQPYEGGHLIFDSKGIEALCIPKDVRETITRKILGSSEVINGSERYCLWIENENFALATSFPAVSAQINKVKEWRLKSERQATRSMATRPHQFCEMKCGNQSVIIVPIRSSENREYLPVALFDERTTVNNLAYSIYDGSLFNLALIASRLHLIWISTVCGKLETRFSYSNKMGWNTFPVPMLTDKNKEDLTRCAEDILLAREHHFPATIAELYDPENMPADLRAAHARNDEVLERIYIGRRFKNDTERLEKLFDLYIKTATSAVPAKGKKS